MNWIWQTKLVRLGLVVCAQLWLNLWFASLVHAQTVYKSIDANGKVFYSEIPPSQASGHELLSGHSTAIKKMPKTLAQTTKRHPVVLYTKPRCEPCDAAREALLHRGIPFKEKIASNPAEKNALVQLLQWQAEADQQAPKIDADDDLPLLKIGDADLQTFNEDEWMNSLTQVGYPKVALLPPTEQQETANTPKASKLSGIINALKNWNK